MGGREGGRGAAPSLHCGISTTKQISNVRLTYHQTKKYFFTEQHILFYLLQAVKNDQQNKEQKAQHHNSTTQPAPHLSHFLHTKSFPPPGRIPQPHALTHYSSVKKKGGGGAGAGEHQTKIREGDTPTATSKLTVKTHGNILHWGGGGAHFDSQTQPSQRTPPNASTITVS